MTKISIFVFSIGVGMLINRSRDFAPVASSSEQSRFKSGSHQFARTRSRFQRRHRFNQEVAETLC